MRFWRHPFSPGLQAARQVSDRTRAEVQRSPAPAIKMPVLPRLKTSRPTTPETFRQHTSACGWSLTTAPNQAASRHTAPSVQRSVAYAAVPLQQTLIPAAGLTQPIAPVSLTASSWAEDQNRNSGLADQIAPTAPIQAKASAITSTEKTTTSRASSVLGFLRAQVLHFGRPPSSYLTDATATVNFLCAQTPAHASFPVADPTKLLLPTSSRDANAFAMAPVSFVSSALKLPSGDSSLQIFNRRTLPELNARQGAVILEGTRLGRWVADQLARQTSRPASGTTGFEFSHQCNLSRRVQRSMSTRMNFVALVASSSTDGTLR